MCSSNWKFQIFIYRYIFKINLVDEPDDFFIKYQRIKIQQTSWWTILTLFLFVSLLLIYVAVDLAHRIHQNLDSMDKVILLFISLIITIIELVLIPAILFFIYIPSVSNSPNDDAINRGALIQDIWMILFGLQLGMTLCLRTWIVNSEGDYSKRQLFSNMHDQCNSVSIETTMMLALVPIILPLFLPGVRFYAVVMSWLISLVCYIISNEILGWKEELMIAYAFECFLVIFVICEFELQRLKFYCIATTSIDKQKRAKEALAVEMRYMISNVAHDLKTVSNVFRLHQYN